MESTNCGEMSVICGVCGWEKGVYKLFVGFVEDAFGSAAFSDKACVLEFF